MIIDMDKIKKQLQSGGIELTSGMNKKQTHDWMTKKKT